MADQEQQNQTAEDAELPVTAEAGEAEADTNLHNASSANDLYYVDPTRSVATQRHFPDQCFFGFNCGCFCLYDWMEVLS